MQLSCQDNIERLPNSTTPNESMWVKPTQHLHADCLTRTSTSSVQVTPQHRFGQVVLLYSTTILRFSGWRSLRYWYAAIFRSESEQQQSGEMLYLHIFTTMQIYLNDGSTKFSVTRAQPRRLHTGRHFQQHKYFKSSASVCPSADCNAAVASRWPETRNFREMADSTSELIVRGCR